MRFPPPLEYNENDKKTHEASVRAGASCRVMRKKDFFVKQLAKIAKWGVLALVIGVLGGLVGGAFHRAVDLATEVRGHSPWLVLLLPLGGCLIAFLYTLKNKYGALDTNRVISAVHGETDVPAILAPLIFVSATVSHLLGASVGREGAALQLGGSIGSSVSKVVKSEAREARVLVLSGMAAVFSALFGTPLAAAFFAIEVAVVGAVYYSALVPCMVSAFAGYRVALAIGAEPVRFSVPLVPALSASLAIRVTLLAVLCAGLSIVFCKTVEFAHERGARLFPNPYLRAVVGSVLALALFAIFGIEYSGAGMDVIARAFSGEAAPFAFALKLVITAVCLAAGFKGGEIVPVFFVGATFGCVVGGLLGLSPVLGAAIGFVTVFCGAVNCPTASILLAAEVFGGSGLWLFAYACGLSYLISGNFGLYHAQKCKASKLEED